jgi:endoglucanase
MISNSVNSQNLLKMFISHKMFFKFSNQIILLSCFLFSFFPLLKVLGQEESKYRIVDQYGQLHISGAYILNEKNDTVSLEGMSFFWSQWMGKYYNPECVKWLRDDWHCDIVRAPMATGHGGYLTHPAKEKKKILRVVDAAIDLGIYVIVDWHSHNAQDETEAAVYFFSDLAQHYGNYPNIIYEIYNEPYRVSWDTIVKPYAERVVSAIRQYDRDNIIIIGTPAWSQDVDIAAKNPLEDKNVAYALHFYAGTHQQWLRDKADSARKNGMALWISEFGTCNADGAGPIYYDELNRWFDYMESNKLSWCNWSVADKKETASALKPMACRKGKWTDRKLTESGCLIRNKLRTVNP